MVLYHADGTLDTNFGNGGLIATGFAGGTASATGLVVVRRRDLRGWSGRDGLGRSSPSRPTWAAAPSTRISESVARSRPRCPTACPSSVAPPSPSNPTGISWLAAPTRTGQPAISRPIWSSGIWVPPRNRSAATAMGAGAAGVPQAGPREAGVPQQEPRGAVIPRGGVRRTDEHGHCGPRPTDHRRHVHRDPGPGETCPHSRFSAHIRARPWMPTSVMDASN